MSDSLARAEIARPCVAWIALALVLVVAACRPAAPPTVATVSLQLYGAPNDAAVVIDDSPLGSFDFVAEHGVALPPGLHRVTVHARGYFPWDRLVHAQTGSTPMRVQVVLVSIPD